MNNKIKEKKIVIEIAIRKTQNLIAFQKHFQIGLQSKLEVAPVQIYAKLVHFLLFLPKDKREINFRFINTATTQQKLI